MSAKVIVPESEGYNEAMLKSMMESLMFPSAFFDQPVYVRGLLFAAGPDSNQLARNFVEHRLGLSVLSIGHEAGTEQAWTELSRILGHPQTTSARIGILLPNLDRVGVEAQKQILAAIQAGNHFHWFPSADDFRKVIPALRLSLAVYLGLNRENRMQLLVQSGQTLEIDKDSLQRAPRPNFN